MEVDARCLETPVSHENLNLANVMSGFQKVSGERVPEQVRSDLLGKLRFAGSDGAGFAHRALREALLHDGSGRNDPYSMFGQL